MIKPCHILVCPCSSKPLQIQLDSSLDTDLKYAMEKKDFKRNIRRGHVMGTLSLASAIRMWDPHYCHEWRRGPLGKEPRLLPLFVLSVLHLVFPWISPLRDFRINFSGLVSCAFVTGSIINKKLPHYKFNCNMFMGSLPN